MYGMLLFATAASFFLRRRWFAPPAGGASRSLCGLGAHQNHFYHIDSKYKKWHILSKLHDKEYISLLNALK
jgi:hypothetical protein